MTARSEQDYAYERGVLDALHGQNETGRDAFVALAHTALFAASVSFVGDVAPVTTAIWKLALIAGWAADVMGLLALTFSFGAARRAIDARRAALNDPIAPTAWLAEALNRIALWSFPIALLCLFSFVTANVVHANDRQKEPAADVSDVRTGRSVSSTPSPDLCGAGSSPATTGSGTQRPVKALDRSRSSTASACGSATTTSACSGKEMNANAALQAH